MLEDLKTEVARVNRKLPATGLVTLTWGNVSGIDRDSGHLVIKPSGVPYDELGPDHMVVVSLDSGEVVEGDLRPSSDTPTHLELYRAFAEIGGVTHTHSPWATSFCQAGRELPCFGTTHADHFHGTVPLCRALNESEVTEDYERLTGLAIIECFEGRDPLSMPAVLQHYHAPFTWGETTAKSLENSIALEVCAKMAAAMLKLDPDTRPLPRYLLDKHFLRKHGSGAYYGQK